MTLRDKNNLPDWSLLNSESFQLADFANMLSFPSYSLTSLLLLLFLFVFSWPSQPFNLQFPVYLSYTIELYPLCMLSCTCTYWRSAHMHDYYCSLSVCVSVCYPSSTSLRRACDKFIFLAKFLLNSNGFQLADSVKKLSFPNYSLYFAFARPGRPFSIIEFATW